MAFPFDKNSFSLTPLTLEDAPTLEKIHARCFEHTWDLTSFESFLSDHTIFGYLIQPIGQPHNARGFVLARLVDVEAEIITLCVEPNFQDRGLGHKLMDALLRHLHHERATHLFLEVDETNQPALTLYRRMGFRETGRRKAYYQHGNQRSDALTMQRDFHYIKT